MKCREGSEKEEWGRVRERDPRTARAHVLGMKVASGCNFHRFFVPMLQYYSCLECFGERRYVFPGFYVPTLRYSGDLDQFGERRCNFSLFFVPTLRCPGDLKQFGERRYECDGVFVPTLLSTLVCRYVGVSVCGMSVWMRIWAVRRNAAVVGDAVVCGAL